MIQQENNAKFYVNEQKCTGCGRCVNVCSGHYMGLIIGFGYPEIPYARGVQKDRSAKINRFSSGRK
jgi:Fe-S-cluster-containing hydrogenase component 2